MIRNKANLTSHSVKSLVLLMLCIFSSNDVNAASRDPAGGSAKIVSKLQAMVKDVTSQRDLLKTDNDKLKADLEGLKKELEKLKAEKSVAIATEEKLNSELSAQKSSSEEIHSRLDNTMAKLHEVIDKYNALNKSKNELSVEHGNLQNTQKLTASELSSCERKNLKMYQATKEVIDNYKKSQNKGVFDALLESEPVFQIKDVEFETIVQEYEDKLNKQKYQKELTADATKQ